MLDQALTLPMTCVFMRQCPALCSLPKTRCAACGPRRIWPATSAAVGGQRLIRRRHAVAGKIEPARHRPRLKCRAPCCSLRRLPRAPSKLHGTGPVLACVSLVVLRVARKPAAVTGPASAAPGLKRRALRIQRHNCRIERTLNGPATLFHLQPPVRAVGVRSCWR